MPECGLACIVRQKTNPLNGMWITNKQRMSNGKMTNLIGLIFLTMKITVFDYTVAILILQTETAILTPTYICASKVRIIVCPCEKLRYLSLFNCIFNTYTQ